MKVTSTVEPTALAAKMAFSVVPIPIVKVDYVEMDDVFKTVAATIEPRMELRRMSTAVVMIVDPAAQD